MKSRLFFRENGHVIQTRSRARLGDAAFIVLALAVLMGLLAWGAAVDEQAADQASFEAGRAVGQAQMQQTVADAYRQGVAATTACAEAQP